MRRMLKHKGLWTQRKKERNKKNWMIKNVNRTDRKKKGRKEKKRKCYRMYCVTLLRKIGKCQCDENFIERSVTVRQNIQ